MPATEYVTRRPHPALVGLVLRCTGYRESSAVPLRRRQPPAGSCTLILSLGPAIRLFGPAGPTVPASFLGGMHDRPVITEFTGVQHGIQVDLSPLGVLVLLGRPIAELTNLTPRLDELSAPWLAGLPARLADEPDWPRRFARLDRALLGALHGSRLRPDPEVARAWRELRRSGGTRTVTELAADTGWSRRHLLTRFRDQVGLAPKAAGRVLRFDRAARLLVGEPDPLPDPAGDRVRLPPRPAVGAASGRPSISDVAAACGYADHAHLDREFRSLADCTPSVYLAELAATPVPIPSSPAPDPGLASPP